MDFETSCASGPHRTLASLVGRYQGEWRTWFEPGVLADTSPISGTLRLALGGRVLVHEYQATLQGRAVEGIALIAYHLQRARYEVAWADTFHNGTALMYSIGDGPALDVRGTYPAPEGPDWGWRTEFVPNEEHLLIRHYNLTPEGEGALAVEIRYRRDEPHSS